MTNPLPKIIAVTGQEGSGKDSYGDYLESLGYLHISAGDFLREIAREQGHKDPIPRTVLSEIGDKLKQEYGPSPITESAVRRYQANLSAYPGGLVISGLRRVGELQSVKDHNGIILWIEADIDRRLNNLEIRNRGDHISKADFIKQGEAEYKGETKGGTHGVNINEVEAMADCKVVNNSSLENLFKNADEQLRNSA